MKGYIGLITHAHKRVGSRLHSRIGLVSPAGKNLSSLPWLSCMIFSWGPSIPYLSFFPVTLDGRSASMTKRTRLSVWQGDPVGQEEILRPGERIWPAWYYDKSPSKWEFACNILQCGIAALCPRMIPPTSSIISSRKWHLVQGRAAPALKQGAVQALQRRGFERMQI